MDRLSSPARLMIVSDLDHTMVDHHDPENLSLLRFNELWEFYYRHDSLLVFSTGGSPTLYNELRKEKPLLTPDITIMSVGTEITYGTTMVPDDSWVEILNEKWDRNIVVEETSKFLELTLQILCNEGLTKLVRYCSQKPSNVPTISCYVDKTKAQEVTTALSTRLGERGLNVKIIYSGGMDLDILPQGAGKGQALEYLHKKFTSEGKLPANTLVCGDSGNDAELFSIPNVHGVMVGNAQEEFCSGMLKMQKDDPKIIHATERCAGGIIQAIGHFGLGPNESPRDVTDVAHCHTENANPSHEVVDFNLFYESWRRAEVENCETYIASLKAVCQPLHDSISAIRRIYGDKKGKQFRVWVDSVLPMQISSDTWVVRFKKLESCGVESHSCLCTAVLTSSKVADGLEIFTWMHLHETWSKGSEVKDSASWLM